MKQDMEKEKILKNASWIMMCQVLQALLSFGISMLTARYLGPSNYGILNYVGSIIAFVTPIMKLGLDATLVQEYVNKPSRNGVIAGTALTMNIVSSVLCMIGATCFCAIANPNEKSTVITCILYSLILPAQALGMIQYWFQSKLLSKYTSVISLCAFTLISVYRIYILSTNKGIYWFAVSLPIDYAIIALTLLLILRKKSYCRFSFSIHVAKELIGRSKYYIISSLAVTLFAQTDRVMLKSMVGEVFVGYYSAAFVFMNQISIVFTAIIDSARPAILESHKNSKSVFEDRITQLYSIVIYLSVLISVILTLIAKPLVNFIYGSTYVETADCLRIIVWYSAFSFYGGAKDIWILSEGKQNYLVWLNVSGAIVNIALNMLLIPIWGARGAALASVITQFVTNIVMGFILRPLQHNQELLVRSLNPHVFVATLRSILKRTKRV